MIDIKEHIKEVNKKIFDSIDTQLIPKINNKIFDESRKKLFNYINGIKKRIRSLTYHLDLIRRELYIEKEALLNNCRDNKVLLLSPEHRDKTNIILYEIMERANCLLRDVITDFFSSLDNLAKIIEIYDKNAAGKRMSSVVKSLKHAHVRNKPFAIYIISEWDSWIGTLYNGYRKDAIHFNPENCKVSYIMSWSRIDFSGLGESTNDISICLPSDIVSAMKLKSEMDLLEFVVLLQNRLLNFIGQICAKLDSAPK